MLLLLVCVLLVVLLSSKDPCTCTSDASSNSNTSWISGGHQSIVNTYLLRIQDTSASTASAVEDILRLIAVDKLLALEEDISVSCSNIKHLIPSSPSGYYHVNITQDIYCNMEELCGEEGGWTRLAYLNMSDITQNCPPGLEECEDEGIRLCRIDEEPKGCKSVKFLTNGISYTHICGRVIGYQKGKTDALYNQNKSINGPYLDGVSITCGSPREHVWSYIAGQRSDLLSNANANCPCNRGSTIQIQGFIGNHYYCESGSNSTASRSTLYSSDPLWDGKNCLALEAPCCKSPNLPWFHRDYGNATSTDYLELRVCRSGSRNNEDIPLQLYEIYVK